MRIHFVCECKAGQVLNWNNTYISHLSCDNIEESVSAFDIYTFPVQSSSFEIQSGPTVNSLLSIFHTSYLTLKNKGVSMNIRCLLWYLM